MNFTHHDLPRRSQNETFKKRNAAHIAFNNYRAVFDCSYESIGFNFQNRICGYLEYWV